MIEKPQRRIEVRRETCTGKEDWGGREGQRNETTDQPGSYRVDGETNYLASASERFYRFAAKGNGGAIRHLESAMPVRIFLGQPQNSYRRGGRKHRCN